MIQTWPGLHRAVIESVPSDLQRIQANQTRRPGSLLSRARTPAHCVPPAAPPARCSAPPLQRGVVGSRGLSCAQLLPDLNALMAGAGAKGGARRLKAFAGPGCALIRYTSCAWAPRGLGTYSWVTRSTTQDGKGGAARRAAQRNATSQRQRLRHITTVGGEQRGSGLVALM